MLVPLLALYELSIVLASLFGLPGRTRLHIDPDPGQARGQ
jgi:Sec-independent protein secretion pathway component TatC